MMRYLAGRLLRALLTIFLVVTFAFFVLRLSGDPALLIMSVDAPPESVEAFRKSWGLDQPIWMQYLAYIGHALTGERSRAEGTRRTRCWVRAPDVRGTLRNSMSGLWLWWRLIDDADSGRRRLTPFPHVAPEG